MPQVKLILIVVVLVFGWGMALKSQKALSGGQRAKGAAKYLALGDSYTIGEAVDPEERYPEQVRRLLERNDHLGCGEPEIIAVTGWTTGNLLDAIPENVEGGEGVKGDGTGYDMVSLLIGVNNQYQRRSQDEYREQFELLLRKCIRLAGNRPGHVVVLSIPDYSVTPFGRVKDTALIAAEIDAFNRINYELASTYHVNYIDVTVESRKAVSDPSLIAVDGLHFSGKEYGIWARLMAPVVKEMLR
jgi:lysophospholipase L1-like esterase